MEHVMSKYDPLTAFLKSQGRREVRMSFSEIEQVVGLKLPEKSKAVRAWWSNNPTNNVMTKAWLAAGYKTAQVDVVGQTLSFVPARHPAFGSMKGTTLIAPGVDLTAPIYETWANAADDHNTGGFGEMHQSEITTDKTAGGPASSSSKKPFRHPAWGAMKGAITILPGVDITEPAFEDWKALYGEDK
jgi:hypothetical protein